jgi:hypothetical protein
MSVGLLSAVSEVGAYTLTADRVVATAAAVVALAGAVVNTLALAGRLGQARSAGTVAAIVAGGLGVLVGALVLGTADGGPGTGNGVVGGYVAIALGLIAVVLGGLARTRARRAGTASN